MERHKDWQENKKKNGHTDIRNEGKKDKQRENEGRKNDGEREREKKKKKRMESKTMQETLKKT